MILLKNKDVSDFSNVDKYDSRLVENEFEFSIVCNKTNHLYIIGIYRPPNSNGHIFIDRLETLLSEIPIHAHIFVAGDLNINLDDTKSPVTLSLINLFLSYNIKMHVTEPTRISQYSSTTIDCACSNFDEANVSCSVIPSGLSDHEALYVNVFLKIKHL